jgi:hypothetical protein
VRVWDLNSPPALLKERGVSPQLVHLISKTPLIIDQIISMQRKEDREGNAEAFERMVNKQAALFSTAFLCISFYSLRLCVKYFTVKVF